MKSIFITLRQWAGDRRQPERPSAVDVTKLLQVPETPTLVAKLPKHGKTGEEAGQVWLRLAGEKRLAPAYVAPITEPTLILNQLRYVFCPDCGERVDAWSAGGLFEHAFMTCPGKA